MSKTTTAARILLGAVFFVFGLNKLLHFIPQPPITGPAAEFMGALIASGYFLPLLAATEIVSGLALLTGRYVPLALVLLAPVVVNIVAFHTFLAPAGLPVALVVLALEVFLASQYRSAFRSVLRAGERA
ncbi:MAG TPA: DoxX family membrane protein [Myxococcota bacterium]|nr:DoxX family membrane protein [Myxococcota bacterium]